MNWPKATGSSPTFTVAVTLLVAVSITEGFDTADLREAQALLEELR